MTSIILELFRTINDLKVDYFFEHGQDFIRYEKQSNTLTARIDNPEDYKLNLLLLEEIFNLKENKKMDRSLCVIAKEIKQDWKKVYFGAVPYLKAMEELNSINDNYVYDSGRSIVRYFLANATTWKGEKAREIKKELNSMLISK